jgi:protein gp37
MDSMSEHSAISWTDATWNCLAGCTRVSAGCDLCYAAELAAKRLKNHPTYKGLATVTRSGRAAFTGRVRYVPDKLAEPLRWQTGRRIFVNSMSDLFHEAVPEVVIDRVFAVMALAPRHTFQILTKRPARMQAYCAGLTAERLMDAASHDAEGRLPFAGGHNLWRIAKRHRFTPQLPLDNVWLGVSVENQEVSWERIGRLLLTPAAVRWVSLEPLLGPIDLDGWIGYDLTLGEDESGEYAYGDGLDWVVVGGESGPSHRPMDVAWLQQIAEQCVDEGIPIFVKQDSGPKPGKQGRLSARLWALKQFPGIPEAAHA